MCLLYDIYLLLLSNRKIGPTTVDFERYTHLLCKLKFIDTRNLHQGANIDTINLSSKYYPCNVGYAFVQWMRVGFYGNKELYFLM